MAEDVYINARVPSEWKDEIGRLVDRGLYKDITDFIHEAVRRELNPDVQRQKIKEQMEYLETHDERIKQMLSR